MTTPSPLRFIDVFAGCGGLSLGLLKAGCKGVFAVERSDLAFSTLKHNLIGNPKFSFDWPTWLPKEAMTCEHLLGNYANQLGGLRGKVDLIVGGPPCQGFSTAGKRDPNDPRNRMTEQYLALVGLIQPKFLIIENVAGYNMKFDSKDFSAENIGKEKSYAEYIANRLIESGYHVNAEVVNCAKFGVPQNRLRFIMICERIDKKRSAQNLLLRLEARREEFLVARGLPRKKPVSCGSAISDLEIGKSALVPSTDSPVKGFFEIEYSFKNSLTAYQKLMRSGAARINPDSKRLPKHKEKTISYFKLVQSVCRPGRSLSINERKIVGTQKFATTVLYKGLPAPTITTLPDDILHYSEPRILTVRENARLQSFPDWFSFQGKYTTGGKQRKMECPRYTQVGNAVPPLLAEALGETLIERHAQLDSVEVLNLQSGAHVVGA